MSAAAVNNSYANRLGAILERNARKKRHEYIHARAYGLAATGLHLEPVTIVSEIIREGYPEAAVALESQLVRDDLRRVCAQHWPGPLPSAETNFRTDAQRRSK